ncbi:MAG TPA: mechanosensitive ion channel domain-containing protein [Acidobacteriaceae bacterium]|nr:mechanosensitive ion channel domain-containing protein [Acidobacteriaceae bacterium]
MATPPAPQGSISRPRHILGPIRLTLLLSLCGVLAACIAFSWITRDAMAHLPFLKEQSTTRNLSESQKTIVDLHPWQTAQALAPLAVSAEEVEYAREAERLADHEVDQAFAAALREASAQPRTLTGEALALSKRVAQLQQLVKEDQARVQSLTAAANAPAHAAGGGDELEVAKAQLGLDSDELNDAQQDLARASGDVRARITEELAAHEQVMRKYDGQASNQQIAVLSAQRDTTLAARLKEWFAQRSRYQLIQQAMQQAQADANTLTARHQSLEAAANNAPAATTAPAPQLETNSASPAADATTRLARIKNRSQQQQLLSIYDNRIQTQRQLATVYSKWSAQVLLQHRIVLHLILQSLAAIAFVLICVILCNMLVRRLLDRPSLDHRRTRTLATILQLGVQLVGVAVILSITFGTPRQTPTILGLTTAGLTIALQDFILAFVGWFVLMGKNGVRVGDAVEINGVGGDVTEVSLFRTTLLETGNWTDTGHPTGRRIAFMNKYAITGTYFNFSTTSQWMWDEISVSAPASADTYAAIEQIHKAVLKETEKDAQLAEQEWQRSIKQPGLRELSAVPAVNLRPSPSGINIVVRYITRASSRFEMRNRLYQCVLDVLLKPGASPAHAESSAAR